MRATSARPTARSTSVAAGGGGKDGAFAREREEHAGLPRADVGENDPLLFHVHMEEIAGLVEIGAEVGRDEALAVDVEGEPIAVVHRLERHGERALDHAQRNVPTRAHLAPPHEERESAKRPVAGLSRRAALRLNIRRCCRSDTSARPTELARPPRRTRRWVQPGRERWASTVLALKLSLPAISQTNGASWTPRPVTTCHSTRVSVRRVVLIFATAVSSFASTRVHGDSFRYASTGARSRWRGSARTRHA